MGMVTSHVSVFYIISPEYAFNLKGDIYAKFGKFSQKCKKFQKVLARFGKKLYLYIAFEKKSWLTVLRRDAGRKFG